MKEHSLVAQRRVYDEVKSSGGVLSVVRDQRLLLRVRQARSSYQHFLDEQKKVAAKEKEAVKARKRAASELKGLMAKRKKVVDDSGSLLSEYDKQIAELKKLTGM